MIEDVIAAAIVAAAHCGRIAANPNDVIDILPCTNAIAPLIANVGAPDADAELLARRSIVAAARMRALLRARLYRLWLSLLPRAAACGDVGAALRIPNRILCLPLAEGPLQAIVGTRSKASVFVEATPLAVEYLRKTTINLVTPGAMIAFARARERCTFFVTFPDHHRAPGAAAIDSAFLGEHLQASLLEVLLARYGYELWALGDEGLCRIPCDASKGERVTEVSAAKTVSTVLSTIERFIRSYPAQTLAWPSYRDASRNARERAILLERRAAEAIIRAALRVAGARQVPVLVALLDDIGSL